MVGLVIVLGRVLWLLDEFATLFDVWPFRGEQTAQSSRLHCFQ